MKKLVLLATFIMYGFGYLVAQSNSEDIDIVQAAWGKDKKELVSEYMQGSMKDSIAFWKLYDEYEVKRKALGKERIDIIQQYADNYDALTDAKASQLATAVFANDAKYTALYQTYFKKFDAITGGKNTAKFFQLETYLQTLVKAKIMTDIPFIGQMDNSKMQAPQQ